MWRRGAAQRSAARGVALASTHGARCARGGRADVLARSNPSPPGRLHRVDEFVAAARELANSTRGNDVLIPMGSDFHYYNAPAM